MNNMPKMGAASRFSITLIVLILLCGCSAPEAPSPETVAEPAADTASTPPGPMEANCAIENLPLAFEENQGQFDTQALFAARHGTGTFFFTADSLSAVFTRYAKTTDYSGDPDNPVGETRRTTENFALKIHFQGASDEVAVEGEEPLQGNVSYFRGKDPDGWVSGAPTFSRLVYRDLWPGVDLSYSGSAGQLKAEYRLARAADAGRIRLRYEGQDALRLDEGGQLVIATPWGDLHEETPRATQHDQPVEVTYGLDAAAGEVWFELESVDPDAPLVINP